MRDDDLLNSSGAYTSPIDQVAICQRDRSMPILNGKRLNERITKRQETGEPLRFATFACMPRFTSKRINGKLKYIPNLSPDSRTGFEINSKALASFISSLEERLGIPVDNLIILGDTESRLNAAYLQIPYGKESLTGDVSANERNLLENAMLERLRKKLQPGQQICRTSQLIPTSYYNENSRWKKYFRYFTEVNSSKKFAPRLQARIDALTILGIDTDKAAVLAVRSLAASDAQYAIEGNYLSKVLNLDGICIIDSLPLFQAQKHSVGSGKDISYIFPLAKNEKN